MHRSKALNIITAQIRHICPYLGQDMPLALCYIKAQDIAEREFCYGCDHVETLKERFGLRTFRRKVVFSKCRYCGEAAVLHEKESPHKGTRITSCPGFEPQPDTAKIFVPTDLACTEWMVVDVATGERTPYVNHRGGWEGEAKARRFHLPLVGAPGTVPSDSRDQLRLEAAAEAERNRNSYGSKRKDNADEPAKVRKKKKKEQRR